MTVPSPCIKLCVMDSRNGHCLGCGRTIEEIVAWPVLDEAARRGILALLQARQRSAAGRPAGDHRPAPP